MSWSNLLVDVLLFSIFGFGLIYGLSHGVLGVVKKPLGTLIAFLAAVKASVALSSRVSQRIGDPMAEGLCNRIIESCKKKGHIPSFYKLFGVTDATFNAGASELAEQFIKPCALMLSAIITFFTAFLIAKLVIGIAFRILNSVLNIGPLSYISKALGALLGTLVFGFVSVLFASILDFCISLGIFNEFAFFNSFTGGPVYDFLIGVGSVIFGV